MSARLERCGRSRSRHGFTLVELALVLLIVGLLTRTLSAPLGELLERRRVETTRARLDGVRYALIGHLATRGVLPCPLGRAAAGGRDVPADAGMAGGHCRVAEGGVPAAVLGVGGPLDDDGALLDAWGRPLRYAVSLAGAADGGPFWTAPGAAPAAGIAALGADLVLCGDAAAGACPREALRANAVAFVALSTGSDASGRDVQAENLDGDGVYASAPTSSVDGHRFDDLLVWGSRNELAYWLLRAEWLP